MKKYFLLLSVLVLTSCGGYETLTTPFQFRGEKDINFVGAEATQKQGVIDQNALNANNSNLPAPVPGANAYEVAVNAPIGSVMNDAIVLFHKEAKKICQGQGYRHKVTQKNTKDHVEYLRTQTSTQQIPSVKGIVICDT